MGAKGEALAKQFEAKVEEATALLEKLSDADWRKTTGAEKWTVAATAHHVASSYEPIAHIIKTIAAGQALPHFTQQMLDEMNAQHAQQFAGCTKPETIGLLKQGGMMLSLGTPWSVLRYPWVTTKLLLIISVIMVGAFVLKGGMDAMLTGRGGAEGRLIAGAAYDVVALTIATVLGVFKPGGRWSFKRSAGTAEPVR